MNDVRAVEAHVNPARQEVWRGGGGGGGECLPGKILLVLSSFLCNFGTSVRVLQLTANPSRCVSSAARGSVAQHYSESSTGTRFSRLSDGIHGGHLECNITRGEGGGGGGGGIE